MKLFLSKKIVDLKIKINNIKIDNNSLKQKILCLMIDRQYNQNLPFNNDEQQNGDPNFSQKDAPLDNIQICLIRHIIPPSRFPKLLLFFLYVFELTMITITDS